MPTTEQRIAALEREIAELKRGPTTPARSVAFERIDPTERLRMPEDAVRRMAEAVDDSCIRDLVSDFRRGPAAPSSLAENKSSPRPRSAAVEIPLASPSGVAQCDRIMDVADELDRRDLAQRLGKRGK